MKELGVIDKILSSNDSDVGSASKFDHRVSIKYGTNVQAVKGIITEYCNDSTVHGFKYIGDHKRPILERIVWICAVFISISTCCYMIKTNWDKHSASPFIISFNEKLTPIWDIPFPMITICPETKTIPEIFNFTRAVEKYYDNETLTSEEEYLLAATGQICQDVRVPSLYNTSTKVSNISDLITAMTRIAPTFDDIFEFGEMMMTGLSLSRQNFHKVLTEEGICYSLNSFDSKTVYKKEGLVEGTSFDDDNNKALEWNLERGFNKTANAFDYPLRTFGPGPEKGLFLQLVGNADNSDWYCRGLLSGFKLIVNSPGEVPQVSDSFISIAINQKATVSIKPEILFTSEGLDQYDPFSRQCYYQHERYLKYFQTYTQANCELECLSNLTLAECGCVKFHMPRKESVPVCALGSMGCVNKVRRRAAFQKFQQANHKNQNITTCNCIPTCTTIEYKGQLEDVSSLGDFSLNRNETNMNKLTMVKINFKENGFKALRRSERYTFTDFIGNCGGLLGLSMGVSILSLVELLSFLTIRLSINLRMRRKKRLEIKRLQKYNGNPSY